MLRVALVGAGGMARTHAGCYAANPNAVLVGVMDIREDAAYDLAERHAAEFFTDFDAMLSAIRPDIVDVCCPTPYHVDYVCRAAEGAGELGIRGISTEKPMGIGFSIEIPPSLTPPHPCLHGTHSPHGTASDRSVHDVRADNIASKSVKDSAHAVGKIICSVFPNIHHANQDSVRNRGITTRMCPRPFPYRGSSQT